MTTLIIGNSRTSEMVGDLAALTPAQLRAGGCVAQRMLWFARDGDVLVLPFAPPPEYRDYVTGLTGTDPDTLAVVVPPPGRLGTEILAPDRLTDPGFLRRLRHALGDQPPHEILAVYKDVTVTGLARALAAETALPGYPFSAQAGDALVNSKAGFRALAAGAGVPIAPGTVVTRPEQALTAVTDLFDRGHSVMVKLEFNGGGYGNEILSRTGGVAPAGAPRVEVLPDRAAVLSYLERRWEWLTAGGAHRLVVERFFPDSTTLYAEYLVADEGARLIGVGELLMEPVAIGAVLPAQTIGPQTRAELLDGAQRLVESLRVLGYRGVVSADAIHTPDGPVLFTETNCRLTGSTHVHLVLDGRVVDADHRDERVFLERSGWAVPSFPAAVERLAAAGLGYDPTSRTGVVVTSNEVDADGTVTCCAIAGDLAAAEEMHRRLGGLGPENLR
ncbi:peptide ligase PGM1-related protein [Micromonospora cathayae]|uniref:Peptide ligase PGM1-related protein n=1 Tax=Micromonospora cathayae TaxID=3028804 RepID=A0ABY7ZPL8_9ACTN|nr:peptide ligase PGM1-related protein [Micromonospora sp. HUAS 3]WDZ83894.1 peptide ligase PGM1-related protein [Micromonospora sp. HUAS 3]